ncbi:UNVERIFIED_CONTAM: putative polygalacturonase [Sesamum angustifolium]|uniref:Polygalacturonase n=1 Tax=Sesamum angustifolium TaxID=2727405 RepID=A0AAW2LLU0_9LAMI
MRSSSSSSSHAFSCSLKCSFLHILCSSIYNLLLNSATVNGFTVSENGFSPLMELPVPTNGLYSNTSIRWSRTVVLNIDDFGAKGDGFSDDTKPCTQAPTAVTFHRCKNLKVRNLTLFNGQQLHMAFTHCTHVAASHVTFVAPADSPNTDGIDISASTRVELKDIIITTGDDCISIVSNSSRIRVKNVVCGPGNGISIGSLGKYNSSASVQDVTVSGGALFDSKNGVRIKTWQGGSGFARNITFENIWMKNVSNPIVIDQYYCDSPETCGNQTSAVSIDSIYFCNIKGTSATEEAIRFACSDSYPCKRLYLENIQLTASSGIAAKSFCWKAYGTSTGPVYPPSCISSGEIIIRYRVKSNSTGWRRDDYAVF